MIHEKYNVAVLGNEKAGENLFIKALKFYSSTLKNINATEQIIIYNGADNIFDIITKDKKITITLLNKKNIVDESIWLCHEINKCNIDGIIIVHDLNVKSFDSLKLRFKSIKTCAAFIPIIFIGDKSNATKYNEILKLNTENKQIFNDYEYIVIDENNMLKICNTLNTMMKKSKLCNKIFPPAKTYTKEEIIEELKKLC